MTDESDEQAPDEQAMHETSAEIRRLLRRLVHGAVHGIGERLRVADRICDHVDAVCAARELAVREVQRLTVERDRSIGHLHELRSILLCEQTQLLEPPERDTLTLDETHDEEKQPRDEGERAILEENRGKRPATEGTEPDDLDAPLRP